MGKWLNQKPWQWFKWIKYNAANIKIFKTPETPVVCHWNMDKAQCTALTPVTRQILFISLSFCSQAYGSVSLFQYMGPSARGSWMCRHKEKYIRHNCVCFALRTLNHCSVCQTNWYYVRYCVLGGNICRRSISRTDQQRLFVVLLPCDVIGPVVCLCFKHQLVLVRGYAHISHQKTNTSGKILTCVEPSEGRSLLLGLKSELKSASVTEP